MKEELGTPIAEPPAPANASVRPTLEEIAKAVNTCNQILSGKTIKELEKLLLACVPDPA